MLDNTQDFTPSEFRKEEGPKFKVIQQLVDFRDVLLQAKLFIDIEKPGLYEKDIAILMYQITKEEDTRVVLESPLAARNHFKEGVVAYLIEAQFLESLWYIKINALLFTFLYLFPMMWIIMFTKHSLWIYVCTFSTYFIFLPQEVLKLYG